MIVDYHMHLAADEARLDDAALAPEHLARYVEQARARGVGEICVTEHLHRFASAHGLLDQEWWQASARDDVDAYRAALREAAERGLPVLAGIELDYLPGREPELRAWADDHGWDLVLGSVHWLGGLGVDHPDYPIWDAFAVDDVWRRYFEAVMAAAATGIYDVMAHPDLAKVFGHHAPEAVREALYAEAADAFAAAGVAVEVSTAGLRKPVGELYPAPSFLAACRRAGVPATLASDAHRPEDVARDFDLAAGALRAAGYDAICRFRGRERTEVPLAEPQTRIGVAYDAHRLVAGRPLVLGGVEVPYERGLDGHSDADIVCHALLDATLGALALGDIGRAFPGTEEHRGARSLDLLRRTYDRVEELGWGLGNADCMVVLAAPRLAPHVNAMRAALAGAMRSDVGRVSVRGTTGDGLGFAGRGEGAAAHAVVLLARR